MSLQDAIPQREVAERSELDRGLGRSVWGVLFLLARGTWLVMAFAFVVFVIFGFEPLYAKYSTVGNPTGSHIVQLTPTEARDLQALGVSLGLYAVYRITLGLILISAFVGTAALIFWRKPKDKMALVASFTLLAFCALIGGDLLITLATSQPLFTLPEAVVLIGGIPFICIFFYVFPDGQWVPHWVRIPVLLGALALPIWTIATGEFLEGISSLLMSVLLFGGIPAQIYRYIRVSDRLQRQQSKWIVAGFVLALGGLILSGGQSALFSFAPDSFGHFFVSPLFFTAGFIAFALSFGAAILHYRLWGLDRFINRSIVYGGLVLCVIAVYLAFLDVLGTGLPPFGPIIFGLMATVLVVLLFRPLHERLQRGVNQLMYGERDEPYAVLSRLGQQLEAVVDPAAMLPTIVETIAEALKLPYVELAVKQGQDQGEGESQQLHVAASYGARPEPQPGSGQAAGGDLLSFPLVYVHETVGELRVAPRALSEALTPTDLALLTNLARQAGAAAHAVQITGELERSLQRMVNAREEARRRLGSDLHDGLGHRLASVLRKAEMAANLLDGNASDPTAARLLLGELQGQARAAIDEVRSLAHTLHPPELELLGLAGALRERARDYQQVAGGGERLQIVVEAPEPLGSLPAAVEAAAYYIAQEALTNVARHAHARHCRVRLRLIAPGEASEHASPDSAVGGTDGQAALELEICDDGRGLDVGHVAHVQGGRAGQAGLGLTSMRERAAELGGTCVIEPLPEGGTRVFAVLPYPPE